MLTLCVQVDVDVLSPETTGKYWKVCKASDFFLTTWWQDAKKHCSCYLTAARLAGISASGQHCRKYSEKQKEPSLFHKM
jgi:hypothetical protein